VFTRLLQWRNGLRARLGERIDLVLENVALRQQLAMYERRDRARGRAFHGHDRLFWCLLARLWPRWRKALQVVQPETVKRWRRNPWWRHLRGERRGRPGRPRIDAEAQLLIGRMSRENSLWGSRRIVGELQALGIEVSNSTVRRYRAALPKPGRGQHWSTFFHNHGPHVRDALREGVDERARRILEVLRQLLGVRVRRRAATGAAQRSTPLAGVPEPNSGQRGECCIRRPEHESLTDRARDGPERYSDAA
jgi:hypothetical protein